MLKKKLNKNFNIIQKLILYINYKKNLLIKRNKIKYNNKALKNCFQSLL